MVDHLQGTYMHVGRVDTTFEAETFPSMRSGGLGGMENEALLPARSLSR